MGNGIWGGGGGESAVYGYVFFSLTVNNCSNVATACSADKNYSKQHS